MGARGATVGLKLSSVLPTELVDVVLFAWEGSGDPELLLLLLGSARRPLLSATLDRLLSGGGG